MATFLPWSEKNLSRILESYQMGRMPILDLELSALCKHYLKRGGCIYCDSSVGVPHQGELSLDETFRLLSEAKNELDLQWIYCCGLGEPTDDPKFVPIVEWSAKHDISISIFTNGFNCTKDYLRFLYEHNVCLLMKCDSRNPEVFGKLLGVDDLETVQTIYRGIDTAIEVGFADLDDAGCSRLALSIVPTQYNKEDISEVVRFCKDNNLYPLLGQLEYAGRGQEVFDSLALNNDELLELKVMVEETLDAPYEIPICPAGIGGIHINNVGDCVVHQTTGLSCPWFDLLDASVSTIGNIRETSITELWQLVQQYRTNHEQQIKLWMDTASPDVFGGCGGCQLVSTYLDIVQNDLS